MAASDGRGRPSASASRVPFYVIGAVLLVLAVVSVVLLVRRGDDTARVTLPPLTSPPSTAPPSTAPPSTPAPSTPSANTAPSVGTSPPAPQPGGTTAGGGFVTAGSALRDHVREVGAEESSGVTPIGDGLYALISSSSEAQLLRWQDRTWNVVDTLRTPSSIRRIQTADVTGDGDSEFVLTLSGMRSPGGVYGRSTFEFAMLPFNTVDGREDWIDQLTLQAGDLKSPFRDADGSRTLVWTWTGNMFETS